MAEDRAGADSMRLSGPAGGGRSGKRPGLGSQATIWRAPPPFLAGELPLDRGARPERQGDELADPAGADVDAVEPRLFGADEVVLGVVVEFLVPGPAGQCVDAADADLDRRRLPVRGLEGEPEGLTPVDREEHAARQPRLGQAGGDFVDAMDREPSQAGR